MAHSVMVIEATRGKVWCPFHVDASRIGRDAERERVRLARIKGIDVDQCGLPAEIAIDGTGYCRRHAGETFAPRACRAASQATRPVRNLVDPKLAKFRRSDWDRLVHLPDSLRGHCGMFNIPVSTIEHVKVLASRGDRRLYEQERHESWLWDHVSVSMPTRCPRWEEMCRIKELFFLPHEPAMQLHPVSDYVNNHPYCLHLWRPLDAAIPLPPSIMVGLPELGTLPPR